MLVQEDMEGKHSQGNGRLADENIIDNTHVNVHNEHYIRSDERHSGEKRVMVSSSLVGQKFFSYGR